MSSSEDENEERRQQLQFDGESSDEGEQSQPGFKINQAYAKRFEEKNRRDDLFRAKEKGLLTADTDESSGEEEDEDGEALTPALDLDIMKTISLIRTKDDRIYNNEFQPFQEDNEEDSDSSSDGDGNIDQKVKKEKVVKYKDLVREKILRKMELDDPAAGSDSESEEEENEIKGTAEEPSYNEAQRQLKQAFKSAAGGEESSSDNEDDILTRKVKSREEKKTEEDQFKNYLETLSRNKRAKKKVTGENVEILEGIFKAPAKDADEEFLRNFVLNEGWKDKTFSREVELEDFEKEEEDFEEVENADRYEAKYNFRFEEPDADKIINYPRFDDSLIRRKESSRKRQREAKKERKKQEKNHALEELRRLKNLKRKELESRLEKTAEVAGMKGKALAFSPEDLEKDFDPEEWDRKMAQMFNDDYYGEEDDAFRGDGDDDEGVEWGGNDADESDGEDNTEEKPTIITGDLFEVDRDAESRDIAAQRKKKKKHGVLVDGKSERDAIEEELYKLDYEDVIGGDIKTRFRYRKVKPNSYGLSSEEILAADTSLLQSFVSLKRMAPYREEEWYTTSKHRRKFRTNLEKQLARKEKFAVLNKNKKKRSGEKSTELNAAIVSANKQVPEDAGSEREQENNANAEPEIVKAGEDNTDVENTSGEKRKRRRKRKRTGASEEIEGQKEDIDISGTQVEIKESDEVKQKKKRKRTRGKKSASDSTTKEAIDE